MPRDLVTVFDSDHAGFDDLIHAACATLQPGPTFDVERATEWIDRAEAISPDDPRTLWARYRLAKLDGRFEQAVSRLELIEQRFPEDLPTLRALGNLIEDLATDEAEVALTESEAQELFCFFDVGGGTHLRRIIKRSLSSRGPA